MFPSLLLDLLPLKLRHLINRVVSEAQHAFVDGRRILVAVLMANEVVDYVHKLGKKVSV